MTERQDTQTAEQEKVTRKRTRAGESHARTRQRKAWTLRELGGKPLWDWMGLLIVPFMLALVTVAFTWYQDERQNWLEEKRAQQAQNIEAQRAEAERDLAEQRAQDEIPLWKLCLQTLGYPSNWFQVHQYIHREFIADSSPHALIDKSGQRCFIEPV
jgi:hypothetical protein